MKFAIRILCGACIAGLTVLAAQALPHQAVAIGWLGACLYYILVANRP